ncbi:MAG: aromatic ring-hydroxylating oxygenase subunit alpha [Betaproteobacteria bacterium]
MNPSSSARKWGQPPRLPTTHYLDNRIYSDAQIFAAEKAKIFAAGWKLVCHESELRASGDYKVSSVAGKSIVTVRGKDGVLRSFFNACAHRGAELVRDLRGNLANGFRCFYHLWSYDLEGHNTFMTRPEGYKNVRQEDYGLRPVRTECLLGLVFVSLNDEVDPLQAYLGGVIDHLQEHLAPQEFELFHHHSAVVGANWKLWNDNNTEVYHEFLHVLNRKTGLVQPGFHDRTWQLYRNGHGTCGQTPIRYEAVGLAGRAENMLPGMRPNGIIAIAIFPDVLVLIRGTVMRIDMMTPLAPDRTLVEWRGLGLKGDSAEVRAMRLEHHNQVWGPAGRNLAEDIAAVESQQRNTASGAAAYSVIAREEEMRPQDDCNLRAYYQEWSRRVGRWPHDIDARRDEEGESGTLTRAAHG